MIVSNSNIKTYQKCPMKFYFEVKLNLRPKTYSVPLERGTFGHNCLEVGLRVLKEGGTVEEAQDAVTNLVFNPMILANDPMMHDKAKILRHVMAFISYVDTMPWKILELEEFSTARITDEASFGFTPDFIGEWTKGPKRGLPFVIDYKFTSKYWNDNQIDTAQQMIKYLIYYNKKHGTKMRHAGVVMFNTRAAETATGTSLFLVKWLPVTKEKLVRIEWENEVLVNKIEKFMKMSPEEYLATEAIRTVDEYECMMCNVASLCSRMLEGRNIERTIETDFEKNDYGYN